MEINTELRDSFRERRRHKNLTLRDLSARCGLAISTISLIEKGTLTSIKQSSYDKLREALEMDEPLESLNATLRIGFGHTLWAAPIITMIPNETSRKSYVFFSFGEDANTPIPQNREGKILIPIDEDYHFQGQEVEGSLLVESKVVKYSAKELINHLLTEEADAVVIPNIVVDTHPNRAEMEKVASIVFSVTGSTTLTTIVQDCAYWTAKKEVYNNRPEELSWEKILKDAETAGIKEVAIFYPPKTICENHLVNLIIPRFREFNKQIKKIDLTKIVVDINDIQDTASKIAEKLHKNKPCMVFLLGWQPNSFAISQRIERNQTEDERFICNDIDLLGTLTKGDANLYFQYSLVIKRENEKLANTAVFKDDFLEELFKSVREVNKQRDIIDVLLSQQKDNPSIRINYEDPRKFSTLHMIASYLGMPINECAQALWSINFHFSIYPSYFFHS